MRQYISTVILAGGRGIRIGGSKGLQRLHGRPLIAWILDAVSRQSDEVLISANDALNEYANFGYLVISDLLPGWKGPLAGLQSALSCSHHDYVVSVPCDTPYLPGDLIARLLATVGDAEAAVAVVDGRRQPVIALYRKSVLPKLDAYLNSGACKVSDWLDTLRVVEVDFDNASAFININSAEELAAANQTAMTDTLKIGFVSISDRASRGDYQDEGLPALHDWFSRALESRWQSITRLIPDEQALIEATLKELVDVEGCHLLLTTGGTGPALRDVTPEATLAVADKVLPGFGEQMRAVSLHYVPTAILSRQVGVIRRNCLILNLPGQPKAIKETLDGIFSAVPYCIDLIGGPYIETRPEVITAFRPKSAQRDKL